ncbi:AraC family ligand binding domain-containing protein [Paenibacillus sp. TAB 01]|uniref:AraC family ligand binding domain-containing protein n=1 Tax=Paenibacillus sp. TAB 01 TaxID=3368988 RepID=UPI0037505D5B
MRRQRLLPTLQEHTYFCLPESVGWYRDEPSHLVERPEGALNNFSIHLITNGKGFVEKDNEMHTLQAGDAFLYFPLQKQRYYSSEEEPWERPLGSFLRGEAEGLFDGKRDVPDAFVDCPPVEAA